MTVCAAIPQDMSGKMFTFPQQTNTAHVRLTTSRQNLGAVTVCFRSFTDLRQNYELNTWHSICSTWNASSGLAQLWIDGKPSSRKLIPSKTNINGPIIIVLGQDQDSYGGGFDINQSFVGMMSDVHMWDYVLHSCDIQDYAGDPNLLPGNVLNWKNLEFQTVGTVVVEEKNTCHF
ncbi:Jeltraxin Egg jelly pentraxin Precursor [Larimichthys crocea]|uniref:Jeltraxin Egg jelly pentraxin n=1 Tax=Larimichthys crocea TaxID=215358 RepID=A0A6G0IBU4_LARCR|nr:Jeltraxin Egg jelly pentraxin Precursor [Larimichthys crocea]